MKTLLATVALLIFTATAQAESIQIKRIGTSFEFSGSSFHFDPASDAAWIDIDMTREVSSGRSCYSASGSTVGYSGCARQYDHRVEVVFVPGLKFDALASQLLYISKDGRKMVCATVTEKSRRFRRDLTVIKHTGNCHVESTRDNAGTTIYFNVN